MRKKGKEEVDKSRFCGKGEMFVCVHCGKHVEEDRFDFSSPSCMLNSVKVKKSKAKYEDDDPNKRVIKVEG